MNRLKGFLSDTEYYVLRFEEEKRNNEEMHFFTSKKKGCRSGQILNQLPESIKKNLSSFGGFELENFKLNDLGTRKKFLGRDYQISPRENELLRNKL